ncbi:MAG TPA: baseplate J/gp47 family protein [Candidatus Bilophila faecipullorum]|uniref:Baseplate J/gp47 family protein n=1 Tax=Candidatus Bilophila faecipullorum TaxID=2838482 RepID=A0A9D1QYJ0_9BACT|nr:baseplate J/gp47 family protein [Candidatus Bilophila faecipullorum]
MISVDLSALPPVAFAPQSADETETAVIAAYEAVARVTLQPGDPVRLFLESLAYVLSVQNGLIDLAGRQNLLAYARGGHLDHLGAPMGVSRIRPQPARTTVRFEVDEPLAFDVPIPAGTRVTTQSGGIMFATLAGAVLPAGALSVETSAKATEPGASGNGLLPGQICRLVDPLPYVTRVSNVATTLSGCDEEGDERFRERIRMAPESFSVAGPNGAYEARVRAVSGDIAAVSVTSPTPGVVDVRFVLTDGELPDAAMIEEVENALTPKDVRPLTDKVLVGPPETVDYALAGKWFLSSSDTTLLSSITRAVDAAVEGYRLWQRSKPGRDINPDELVARLKAAGAKRVELAEPAFRRLAETEIARETSVSMAFGGVEDE